MLCHVLCWEEVNLLIFSANKSRKIKAPWSFNTAYVAEKGKLGGKPVVCWGEVKALQPNTSSPPHSQQRVAKATQSFWTSQQAGWETDLLCLEVRYLSLWGCLALWQSVFTWMCLIARGQVWICAIHLLLYSGVSCVLILSCVLLQKYGFWIMKIVGNLERIQSWLVQSGLFIYRYSDCIWRFPSCCNIPAWQCCAPCGQEWMGRGKNVRLVVQMGVKGWIWESEYSLDLEEVDAECRSTWFTLSA